MIKNSVFDFLTADDNLETSLEIYGFVDELQSNIHKEFWPMMNNTMSRMLSNSDASSYWKVKHYPTNRIFSGWNEFQYLPKNEFLGKNASLIFAFFQAGRDSQYNLGCGVKWSKLQNSKNANLITLKSLLQSHKINLMDEPMWINWGRSTFHLYEPETLRRMYLEPEEMVQEIAGYAWKVFSDVHQEMEKINRSLAGI